jgi:adenosylcobinamide-GDP ribazoletransferase
MIDRLAVAHAFLTRLPLPGIGPIDRTRFARAAALFPLVGLTVGGLAALARIAAEPLGATFASVCAVGVAAAATGALHEDGLADTADALGARDRARRLEVMRDPRIGTFGVLALVLVLLARIALLSQLTTRDAALALLAAHVLARWSVLPQAALVRPARTDGSAALIAGLGTGPLLIGTALTLASSGPLLFAIDAWALVALAVSAALTALCALAWRRAFGGLAGDTYGATAQLVELGCYACVVAAAV